MNIDSNYTLLESLLLFQSLRANGVDNINFTIISDQLKSIPLVRDAPTYNIDRLSPDALRDLYLRLVKEEVKDDLDRHREVEAKAQNRDLSPASRKRKLATPPHLSNIQDAVQHQHLIPQLVTRLYTRYRESTVAKLQEYERNHDQLLRQKSETTSTPNGLGAPTNGKLVTEEGHDSSRSAAAEGSRDRQTQETSRRSPVEVGNATLNKVEHSNGSNEQTSRRIDSTEAASRSSPSIDTAKVVIPKTSLPTDSSDRASHPTATQVLPYQTSASTRDQSSHPDRVASTAQSSTASHVVPGATPLPSTSPHPSLPPTPTFQQQQQPQPPRQQLSRPFTHLPQNAQAPPVPYSTPQHPQHQPAAGRPPAPQLPSRNQNVSSPYPPPQLGPPGYFQPTPIADQRVQHNASQQRHPVNAYPTQPPHAGGYQLQPFYLESSTPNGPRTQPQQSLRGYHAPQPVSRVSQSFPPPISSPQALPPQYQLQHQPQGPRTPATGPRASTRPQLLTDIVAALATPPRSQRRPLWKSDSRDTPNANGAAPTRPQVEPLSPTLARARSPSKPSRARPANDSQAADSTRPFAARRSARDKSPHSVESSNNTKPERARRKRSRSTASVAEVESVIDDHDIGRREIKPEPSTPAEDADHQDDASVALIPRGRKRRGTLQPSVSNKKMRAQSRSTTVDDVSTTAGTPPPRPQTIFASRNLTKLSATLMNDINSHKHASYFAGPVRDRDAEGYSEIIKRPQHLKSIRAAVTAGTRAVAAAIESLDESSLSVTSQKGSDKFATIELERSVEVMPPKAIVNGVQLEKEIMRMFANAVMFNPGQDGLVADTREMYEEVEAKIRDWRGIERDTMGDEDEDGKAKRRKL